MFFDRQALYLAFVFASANVLALPLSLAAIENESVEQTADISPSANLNTLSHQTAKISRLLPNYIPVPSNTILSGHPSDVSPSVPVNSASATASPSPSALTSPNLNDLRPSLPKATQLSTDAGNVEFESPNTGNSHEEITMALLPETTPIIAGRDASPAASGGLLGTLEGLLTSVVSEVAAASTSDAASTSGAASASDAASSSEAVLTTSASQAVSNSASPTPTTTNALSILFSALPSSVADPLRSQFNSEISAIVPADQSSTNTASTSQTSATHSPTNSKSATAGRTHTGRPTRTQTGRPTNRPTKHNSSKTTTSSTSKSTQTSPSTATSTATQTDPMSDNRPTGPPQPSIGSNPISNASIIGIVFGLVAAAVVAGLAAVYILRRKKAGKAVFGGLGRGGSKRSTGSGPYPAVAWLYDPKPSPPGTSGNSRRGSVADGAEERLIPEPRHGSVEMSGGEAPILPPARPSSPLLAPMHMPPARDRSPSPGRHRASSNADRDDTPFLRPISED